MDWPSLSLLLFALLLRWCVSLHSYSGHAQPPIYGDYEAQRHWMEVTVNLPSNQWYHNGTDNDLQYWGLDYPPLTAYHSKLMGLVARKVNPSWVELHHSRGYESYHHKIFMRSTVLLSDLLIYITAMWFFWHDSRFKSNLQSIYLLRSLIAPAIILIDHGHFQYNSISLGLLLWTLLTLRAQWDVIGAVLFTLALNYKQMALYYSLPIFVYLLKRCFIAKSLLFKLTKFSALAIAVLLTFTLLWLPFLSDIETVLQVVRRIFPLNRGIYEDKVANFWYCLSVIVKVKQFFSDVQLAAISAGLTLSVSLPSCNMLFQRHSVDMLQYALVNVALAFFLFSFQVHEKTILFVTSALSTLTATHPFVAFWFEMIATFSLQPLLVKDGLMVPYFILPLVYATACQDSFRSQNRRVKQLFALSITGCILLSITNLTIQAPNRFPHIHILLNCFYSFGHFVIFLLYFLNQQYRLYQSKQNSMTYIQSKIKQK